CGLGIFGFVAPVTGRQPLARVSVDDALRIALQQTPTVRAQQAALTSTKAAEITAALRPNPSMNFLAEQLRPGQSQQDAQYTVNVGQPIELGGKRGRRIDSARAATQGAGYQLQGIRRQVTLQGKNAFAAPLHARAQLALAQENVKALDDSERIQRLRAEKGDISELELLRIQVQRFTFERDAADARQALAAAKIAVRAAAGAQAIAEEFDLVGELGFKDFPLDKSVLMRRGPGKRPAPL